MRRSEPAKDLVEQEINTIFKQHIMKIGTFSEDENETEIIEREEIKEIEHEELLDALPLLSETMNIFNSLQEYYYNGDRSLKSPPVVFLEQLYSYQHHSTMEELQELKKLKLMEIVIRIENKEMIGIMDKYEYINYLLLYFNKTDSELIQQLIDYVVKSNGNCLLPLTLFTKEEKLKLIRKDYLLKRKRIIF